MALDKELYRKAYELHRQWNEAELKERLRIANKRTSRQGWRQYLELWEFGWNMHLRQSQRQILEKIKALDEYYIRIQKFEAWRRFHGRTP